MRHTDRLDPSQEIEGLFGWFFLALKFCGLSDYIDNREDYDSSGDGDSSRDGDSSGYNDHSEEVSDNDRADSQEIVSLLPEDIVQRQLVRLMLNVQYNDDHGSMSSFDEGKRPRYLPSPPMPIQSTSPSLSSESSYIPDIADRIPSITDRPPSNWGGRMCADNEGSDEKVVNNDNQREQEMDDYSPPLSGSLSPQSVLENAFFRMDDIDNPVSPGSTVTVGSSR